MRIAGWYIEGFGIFEDFEVRLGPGLTVFLGPNEAGKSTLLGFLRAMLFGFPGRRGRTLQYPPLRGGRHGGRLTLDGPGGETAVERIGGRRNGLAVNGRESSQQDLAALLGGADESLFSSVFAFSLSEMQSFEWLKAEQVRERIFSAGIAGAGASARRVMDTLAAEAAALLRPRGASTVREITARIERAEEQLRAARAEAERYVALEREEEMWSERAASLSAEEAGLQQRHRSLETALGVWSECERARQELSKLDPIAQFPAEPEVRFRTLAKNVEVARDALRRIEEEREPLHPDDRLESIASSVEEFHGKLAAHRECLQTLAGIRERKSRNAPWMAAGVAIAFAEVWLAGRNGVAAAIAALLAGLVAGGFLLFEHASRRVTAARLEQQIAAWEDPVRQWLASSNSGEPLIAAFLDLRERCRNDRETRAKASGDRIRGESAQVELARAEEALKSLLREAGAADETQFQSRLRTFRKRQELSALIQDCEAQIGDTSGDPTEWPAKLSRLLENWRHVRQQRDDAVGARRLASAERQRIAESTAIPAIQADLEYLREELAAAVRDWRTATLARELVAHTLQEFTRTRQPAVLDQASSAFARVTAGAYERILQEEDREGLLVVDCRGLRKRPEELSRGTAEQLYLCLRLGLAAEFARRSMSLPLIMDDVLVNFDPERARAIASELVLFSSQRQILVFTCHPETARLFCEAAPGTAVIHLLRHASAAKE